MFPFGIGFSFLSLVLISLLLKKKAAVVNHVSVIDGKSVFFFLLVEANPWGRYYHWRETNQ